MEYPEETQLRKKAEEIAKNFSRTKEFADAMTLYRCAIMEVQTKLNVLNEEFSLQYDRNPFESIESRLKSPTSIVEKMLSKGLDINVENMEGEIFDIAGIRVVCSFREDIYKLSDLLVQQDDILLLARKDYIANPKPNGYRSFHIIVDIPIFLSEGKKHMKVEVQFRTIAMDFWASVDHKLKYKKELKHPEEVVARLKKCADNLAEMDDETKDMVKAILGNFEDLPDSMQDVGGDTLQGLIGGMEDYIPELGDMSDMTADEIVDTFNDIAENMAFQRDALLRRLLQRLRDLLPFFLPFLRDLQRGIHSRCVSRLRVDLLRDSLFLQRSLGCLRFRTKLFLALADCLLCIRHDFLLPLPCKLHLPLAALALERVPLCFKLCHCIRR